MTSNNDNILATLVSMLIADHYDEIAIHLVNAELVSCEDGYSIAIPALNWKMWKNDHKKQQIVRQWLRSLLHDMHVPLDPSAKITYVLQLTEKTPAWEDGIRAWIDKSLTRASSPVHDHTVCEQRIAAMLKEIEEYEWQLLTLDAQHATELLNLEAQHEAERLISEAQVEAAQTNYQDTLQELECSQALLRWYETKRARLSQYMRDTALAFAGHRCMMNDEHTENLQIDRLIPGAQGGKYTWENIQVLCQLCNGLKKDHVGEGWDYRTPEFIALCQRELDRVNAQENLF